MVYNVLIVGASRGLGFALLQQFQSRPDIEAIAGIRNPGSASVKTKSVSIDITDDASVAAAAAQIPTLDILVVNAAIGNAEKILKTSTERLGEYMEVNVIGTHRVVTAFLPALHRGKAKKIVIVSSQSASMERQIGAKRGFSGPYAVSKAACNMLAVQYHNELNDGQGATPFVVVAVHPGWVATDMGKLAGDGGMDPAVSAKGVVDLVLGLRVEDSAGFFAWDGSRLPW